MIQNLLFGVSGPVANPEEDLDYPIILWIPATRADGNITRRNQEDEEPPQIEGSRGGWVD